MMLTMPLGLKAIQVMLVGSVKFFLAVPLAFGYGLSCWQAFIFSVAGGTAGILVFYFLTPALMKALKVFLLSIKHLFKNKQHQKKIKKDPRKFSKKNRVIIHIRGKLGLFGIALLTPVFLSIPLGSILANKYYAHNRFTLLILFGSVVLWSGILCLAFFRPAW